MRALFLTTALLSVVFFSSSCRVTKKTVQDPKIGLRLTLDTSSVFRNSLTGLVIYEPSSGKELFSKNARTYFTPASNTKILSLFAALSTLGDSIPALRYLDTGDSLIFWGTGDPTLLHPDFSLSRVPDFLRSFPGRSLFYSSANVMTPALGPGWAWDDYNDDYQPEISGLPVYGNIARAKLADGRVSVNPGAFLPVFLMDPGAAGGTILRHPEDNHFVVPAKIMQSRNHKQDIPFKTSGELTALLLSDTLGVPVTKINRLMPHNAGTIYSLPVDTVYRRMMQVSDNMLAEHLLLLAGNTFSDTISTAASIKAIRKHFLDDITSDPVKWVDGSGLSRYNLFTPLSLVKLLEKMHGMISEQRLYGILAAGGQSGTLKTAYKPGGPFIFAKSGSLTGVYNLSGYLITRSGKTLIFSFMNNNFVHPVSRVRNEVARVLTWVHENY